MKIIVLVTEHHTESRPKTMANVLMTNATSMASNLNSQLVQWISQLLPRFVIHRCNISGCHNATFTLETSRDSDAVDAVISTTLYQK
jgi:hypothetical protein